MKQTNYLMRVLAVMLVAMCFISPASAQKKGEVKKVFTMDIHCQNCVNEIEKTISWEKGVTDLKCNMANNTVEVTYKESKTNEEKLIAAFKKIGKDDVVKCDQDANCDKKGACEKQNECTKGACQGSSCSKATNSHAGHNH